jgi:hypothetical protein
MAIAANLVPRFRIHRGVDAFLLRHRERLVAGKPSVVIARIAALCRAADRRAELARDIEAESGLGIAIDLLRDAEVLLAAAYVCQMRGNVEPQQLEPIAVWQAFENALSADTRASSPEAIDRVREFVCRHEVAIAEGLDEERLIVLRDDFATLVRWTRSLVEPRSQKTIRVLRGVRVAVLAWVVLVALAVLGSYLFAPKNIARGVPVQVSSRYPGSADPAGVTNGDLEVTFGAHTSVESSPWIAIDLGSVRVVRQVRVTGRGDGLEQESVPLVLEISEDGIAYVEVERRTVPISRSVSWTSTFGRRNARFVRVRRPSHGYVALTEIEVFAAR